MLDGALVVLHFTMQFLAGHKSAEAGLCYWIMFAVCSLTTGIAISIPLAVIPYFLDFFAKENEEFLLWKFGIALIPISIGTECVIRVSSTLITQGLFGIFVLLFGFLLAIEESRLEGK